MKQVRLNYTCDLCGKESDYAGVMGFVFDTGINQIRLTASKCGEKHICMECWNKIKTIQERLAGAVV